MGWDGGDVFCLLCRLWRAPFHNGVSGILACLDGYWVLFYFLVSLFTAYSFFISINC